MILQPLNASHEPPRPRPAVFLAPQPLSDLLGVELTLVTETFQYTGSFKARAALQLVQTIPHPRVITASSGNFGQAAAFACQMVGKGCTVVMPDNSAQVKVDAVRRYGATIDFVHTADVSRERRVAELADADPAAYVASSHEAPYIIEGNASLGKEIAAYAQSVGAFDAILLPIGGGGLGAGLVTGLRAAGDTTPVYGVEPLLANDAARSLRAGHIVANAEEPATIADGVRLLSVGTLNWQVLQRELTGIIEVAEAHITETVRLLFRLANLKAEPTGALATAALLAAPATFSRRRVCAVVSGGNVDPVLYAKILVGEL